MYSKKTPKIRVPITK